MPLFKQILFCLILVTSYLGSESLDRLQAEHSCRVLKDENGQVKLCHCVHYNEKGQVIEELLVGNLSGTCPIPCEMDEKGHPKLNGVESYRIRYFYSEEDPHLLLSRIEENGCVTTYVYDSSSKQCIAILKQHPSGYLTSRCFYFYDAQGFLERAIFDDGQAQDCDDLTGVSQRQIIQFEVGHASPLIGKPLKMRNFYWEPSCSDSNGELLCEISFDYDEQGQLISGFDCEDMIFVRTNADDPSVVPPANWWDLFNMNQIWNKVTNSFSSCLQSLQFSAHQIRANWEKQLKLPDPLAHALEKMGKTLLGEASYLLMGFHAEETHMYSYGQREIHDKVRVTFINGILNTRKMMVQSLDLISSSHGGVKVHYVFRPTEGWTSDIFRAILIKTVFTFGFRSSHAYLLAQMWKELIEEMGGIEGGGVIVHYAHSLGGSETDRARELLSPEEQKMIRVVTFGSATLVRNVGFQSVLNIVSLNDGVTLLDPFGHTRNYFDPNCNVQFRGPVFFKSSAWPLCDHALTSPIYGPTLQEYGEKFLAEFTESQ